MQENDSIQGIVNTIKKKKSSSGGVQTAGRQSYSSENDAPPVGKKSMPEGSNEDLQAMTPEKAQEFLSAIENAMQEGKKEVEFDGKRWAVSSNLVQAVQGKVSGGVSQASKGGVSSAQSSHQVASNRRSSSPPSRPPSRPPARRP
tara:strand:+ start:8933 stop:9367 length:435 start_codon:yes stop_codon:yes gene_type:complete